MSAPQMTPGEIAHLLKQPDVANTLARYNRAQAMQSADAQTRMTHLERVRMFERMERK